MDTGAGQLVVVRREYPAQRIGTAPAARRARSRRRLDLLARSRASTRRLEDARRLLFLDTETTGLAGGTGTYAFLVGAGWLEGDRFVLTQHFMRDFDEEPALLARAGAAARAGQRRS